MLDQIDYHQRRTARTGTQDSPAALAHDSLLDFTQYTFPRYAAAPHHRRLIERLEAVERGEVRRLMVFMPPRHGKSELVSVRFPAWYLGRNPDKRVILSSYGAALAHDFSRQVRNLVASDEYAQTFGRLGQRAKAVRLADDSRAVDAWSLAPPHRGGMVAAGVGGALSGRGAHCMVIDDPVKDRLEANSPTFRDRLWDWYCAVARTRLEDDAAVVVCQTRWHDDDLSGRLLRAAKDDAQADQWTVLHFPAIDDGGSALWPQKYPICELERIRATIGTWEFAALYQGDPKPQEGAIFRAEWFPRIERLPQRATCRIIQAWDTAFEEDRGADYTACVTLGIADNRIYVMNVWRQRLEFPDLIEAIQRQAEAWSPEAILIEDSGSGKSSRQQLNRLTLLPVIKVRAADYGDKTTRAMFVTPYCEAGKVWLPQAAPWLSVFEEELFRFPSAEHDDQVDAFVYALMRAGRGARVRRVHDD